LRAAQRRLEDSGALPLPPRPLIVRDARLRTLSRPCSPPRRASQQTLRKTPVGEIRRRDRNGRVTYLARHSGPEGRKVSKSFNRQKDAKDWLTTVGSSKLTGSYADPNRSKVTVGAWADEWLESKLDLAPKTRD
jgi:hypothetical protein